MKTIKSLSVIAILLMISLSGCMDDFLEKKPLIERTEVNFYQSPQDAQEALFAVYDVTTWQSGGDFHPYDLVVNILSDDAYAGGSDSGDQPELVEFNRHDISTTNNKVRGIWGDRYTGIYRANLLLDRIQDIEFDDPAEKALYIAEARFLRAFFYFDLIRFYGEIPFFERPLVAADNEMTLSPPEVVYNFIASELAAAIPDLRENIPTAEKGRVSKWAAKSLLGRVYLYHKDYAQPVWGLSDLPVTRNEVIGHLEDVINLSGHALVSDFGDLWGVSNEHNIESIFEINHMSTAYGDWGWLNGTLGNWTGIMTGLRGIPNSHDVYAPGWSFQPVTPALVNEFDPDNDSRYFHSILDPVAENIPHNAGQMFQWAGFAFKKFHPRAEDRPTFNQEHNWPYNRPVIRYSDVLLMAAELGAANAQQYFDEVRERAFGPGFQSLPPTKENIIAERRLEFAGEGHRYWDLLRLGLNETQTTLQAASNQAIDDEAPIEFNPARKGVFPIPDSEIILSNGALKQHSFYQ